jgi:lipopolysaccharide transport system ATP-binding protein
MEEREIVIKAEKIKKVYRLGVIGSGTLRRDLQSAFARLRKKEDPNSRIGAKTKNGLFTALDDIDFTVYKGEKVGIIGHNGAGKTTLLKLLTKITGPTDGEIRIKGKISSLLEVGTGFSAELTGRENIFLNGSILGMTKREIKEKIESIIDFSEVREFIDTPLKRYSMGMFVKLAFAIAVHLDSEIVLMDEVLAVGDVAFQKKCLDKMNEMSKEQGRTILYVSHNMETIKNLCDRCIVLEKGKKVFDGEVDKAIECYINSTKNCQ